MVKHCQGRLNHDPLVHERLVYGPDARKLVFEVPYHITWILIRSEVLREKEPVSLKTPFL